MSILCRKGILKEDRLISGGIDLAGAYERLLPRLMAVVRRLASQGYVSDAGQGLDLVHDFFIQMWPQVEKNFAPSKGDLVPYVTVAFERFARRRLVREARWSRMLSDPLSVEFAESVPVESEEYADRERLRAVLATLPVEEREILALRFGDREISERAVARQIGVTRYELRRRVAMALARFASRLGESGVLGHKDFAVATLLFEKELPLEAVAAHLSITVPQVRNARRRILRALGGPRS